ncbi:MAG: hypothetical protein JWQ96_2413 [Segetibacter sp.]|nr:hypothetical protein [Segetibacter sp.]
MTTQQPSPKNFKLTLCLLVVLLFPIPFVAYKANVLEVNTSRDLAKRHSIIYHKPAPDFFEGALLGNGGMGVVVTTRPDAVVLYFGHNNVWDTRIAEEHKDDIKDFKYVFDRVKNIPDTLAKLTHNEWYKKYHKTASGNYNKPFPRPFPCGSIVLGFDKRKVELIGHTLDISNGICAVELLAAGKKVFLHLMTDMNNDRLLMQLVDESREPADNIFERVKILADPSTPNDFPKYKVVEDLAAGVLSFTQVFPSQIPSKEETAAGTKEKAFSLTVKVNAPIKKAKRLNLNGGVEKMAQLEGGLSNKGTFSAVVVLREGFKDKVEGALIGIVKPSYNLFTTLLRKNEVVWDEYWSKSSVELGDTLLEQLWYSNLYFFNCAAKDGVNSPGLFANWSYNNIGSEWHGDYHFNYNIQQPFWATFSSNHLEKNLPYVNLIEFLMPLSRKWASDYYGLPGASFPHAAYPVSMTMNPYPIPDWGWQVSETPWAVQGLWWHYLYSGDTAFLRTRAYEPIKAAVQFLVGYMKREEAHGGDKWKDNKYHIYPTVPPEVHGLMPGLIYNYDCSIDLALTKFIFKAFENAARTLGTASVEHELLSDIQKILQNYPGYPTAYSSEFGEIFVAAPGEHDDVVYNVPISLSPVFPGEDGGLHSDKSTLKKFINTYRNQQTEGGNDLVFSNMQAARLGLLDLEKFRREVNYCLLPNGTAANLVMQTRGRYNDQSDFRFMARSGIWFENFALPAVINECLLQGYNGTLRLFPNWPKEKDASFKNLRAAGAFLVSATQKNGKVTEVKIVSEKGNQLSVIVPWGKGGFVVTATGRKDIEDEVLVIETVPSEVITLRH